MSRNIEYDEELTRLRASFTRGVFTHSAEPLFNRAGEIVIGKCTEPDIWSLEAKSICDQMLSTYEAKDTDYAANGKPMGNLRMSEEIGVPAWKGVLIRMGDKKRRIESFSQRGTYEVNSESVHDTFIDLSNYSLLGLLLFRETVSKTLEETSAANEPLYFTQERDDVEAAYLHLAQLAIYLAVLFQKGLSDAEVIPWNQSKQWEELKNCYEKIALFARNNP